MHTYCWVSWSGCPGPVSARTWEMLPPRWSWHNWGLTECRSSHRLLRVLSKQPRLPVLKVRARAGIISALHRVASRGTVTPAISHSLSPGSNLGCISPAIIGRSQKAPHNALTRCSSHMCPCWHMWHMGWGLGNVLIMSHETLSLSLQGWLLWAGLADDTAAQLAWPRDQSGYSEAVVTSLSCTPSNMCHLAK